MKVAILGCGPAGLLAAHAAVLEGHEPRVFSRKQKSFISGAQYLHEAIPGIGDGTPDGNLMYIKAGDRQGYAAKVYGDPDHLCSWDKFPEGELPAWSMYSLYNRLWQDYHGLIEDQLMDSERIVELCGQGYRLIISAIPAPALCHIKHHQFHQRRVMFSDRCAHDHDNVIVYSGEEGDPWYRSSRIFGVESTEFPVGVNGAATGQVHTGVKPTSHTCSCFPDVVRVGRFGQWRQGVLVHHAFQEARDALQRVQ